VPTFTPFNFHWNVGAVPPLTGIAVKFTVVPAQMFVDAAEMLIDGVTGIVTTIVTALDVAVFIDAQAALLVNSQVTTSPLTKVLLL
jgi:hypothetical protein